MQKIEGLNNYKITADGLITGAVPRHAPVAQPGPVLRAKGGRSGSHKPNMRQNLPALRNTSSGIGMRRKNSENFIRQNIGKVNQFKDAKIRPDVLKPSPQLQLNPLIVNT